MEQGSTSCHPGRLAVLGVGKIALLFCFRGRRQGRQPLNIYMSPRNIGKMISQLIQAPPPCYQWGHLSPDQGWCQRHRARGFFLSIQNVGFKPRIMEIPMIIFGYFRDEMGTWWCYNWKPFDLGWFGPIHVWKWNILNGCLCKFHITSILFVQIPNWKWNLICERYLGFYPIKRLDPNEHGPRLDAS